MAYLGGSLKDPSIAGFMDGHRPLGDHEQPQAKAHEGVTPTGVS